MIRGVVERDLGLTWGMTTEKWMELPVCEFLIRDLVVTQEGITFAGLMKSGSFSGDPFPHVVVASGVPYLEDGHHRLVRAMLAGLRTLRARRLEVT